MHSFAQKICGNFAVPNRPGRSLVLPRRGSVPSSSCHRPANAVLPCPAGIAPNCGSLIGSRGPDSCRQSPLWNISGADPSSLSGFTPVRLERFLSLANQPDTMGPAVVDSEARQCFHDIPGLALALRKLTILRSSPADAQATLRSSSNLDITNYVTLAKFLSVSSTSITSVTGKDRQCRRRSPTPGRKKFIITSAGAQRLASAKRQTFVLLFQKKCASHLGRLNKSHSSLVASSSTYSNRPTSNLFFYHGLAL